MRARSRPAAAGGARQTGRETRAAKPSRPKRRLLHRRRQGTRAAPNLALLPRRSRAPLAAPQAAAARPGARAPLWRTDPRSSLRTCRSTRCAWHALLFSAHCCFRWLPKQPALLVLRTLCRRRSLCLHRRPHGMQADVLDFVIRQLNPQNPMLPCCHSIDA